ncbi:MAG: MarR family winged helix-turn-helix transcriptional regulator [Acidovorax sp.]
MSEISSPPQTTQGPYHAEHMEPEENIGYLMRKVMTSLRSQVDARLAACGMTYVQWLPLYKLAMMGNATAANLARDMEIDPGAMTRVIDRLVAKGLVLRERSLADRRVIHLVLTDEGRRAAAQVPPVMADVLNAHLQGFSHAEWQQLLRLLKRILANGEALRP